jgi:hypothetical protein
VSLVRTMANGAPEVVTRANIITTVRPTPQVG